MLQQRVYANKGAALVVSGSNDVNVQILVNAINEAIGSTGNTINWSVTNNSKAGVDADFVKPVDDMNAVPLKHLLSSVQTRLIHGNDTDKVKMV